MTIAEILAWLSAAIAVVLAMIAMLRTQRTMAMQAFAGGMLVLAVERMLCAIAVQQTEIAQTVRWLGFGAMARAVIPFPWLLFSLTYARENARECAWRWRWLLVMALVVPAALCAALPGSLPAAAMDEKTGLVHFTLGGLGSVRNLLLLFVSILILLNLERSFRASVGLIRWRIKFMIMGVGLLFIIRIFTASQILLYREVTHAMEALNSCGLLMAAVLIFRSIFRDEPLALNVHPSQSVLQGTVTVIFAGVYLIVIGMLASLANHLGGDDSFVIKAFIVLVATVALAVLLQSDRVNLALRRLVSRHFKRPLYDYQAVWRRFTEGTASRVEQSDFSQAVVMLLADTFKALCVTLWIVDERRGDFEFAASTSLQAAKAAELKPDAAGTAIVIKHLRGHTDPFDIEHESEVWAVILRACHPDAFRKGGNRVCVPIVSRGEVLAFITLGDRVSGSAFTLQDLDLLKSIGEHVASGLLNVRLSQRLLQSREHEAFQTMAAFFVHDLKNAASTLSLMLQNLPTHFDDPEFRRDALRGVGKSVDHINHLISRLSELRRELRIQTRESDLNAVVTQVLAGFEPGPSLTVETGLEPLPRLALDPEQFGKVILNLVLNARDATNGQGQIRITTTRQGAWAMLATTDNGCGMPADFLEKSLFRPFQTTKKNGLGIGMFQSRMIVEAHGGRIAADSKPGQGSTFRVFLPLPPSTR